eukprot:9798075-Karenia_brevis.AAC.1
MRDANLPDKARDLIEMWSGVDYSYDQMQWLFKRLERPIPGMGGQRITVDTTGTSTTSAAEETL